MTTKKTTTDETPDKAVPGAEAPKDEQIIPDGRLTEEKLEELKKLNPQGVYSLIVQKKDGSYGQVYYKKPGRNELNYSKTKRDPEAPDAQYIALSDVTYLGGDDAVLKDEQAMISVTAYMEVMPVGATAFVLNH